MAVGTESIDTVHLVPDKILMKQKLDMTMFDITLYRVSQKKLSLVENSRGKYNYCEWEIQ